MKRLNDVLQHREENYILPFFWQHGEKEADLREGMEKIASSGIRAVCVESRPHPDFVGDKWWEDMDIILDEAKKRDMKVWILDDAHFPTGFVNGKVKEYPEIEKEWLVHYSIDAVGPARESAFLIALEEREEEKFVGAVAARRDRRDKTKRTELIDLTDKVENGRIYWDVPEGLWSVIILKRTKKGHEKQDHCSLIDRRATRKLIEICYEPHYEHYKEDFGKTIAGFFSDEPQFGCSIPSSDLQVGCHNLALPWCDELEAVLHEKWGKDFLPSLVGCWYETPEYSRSGRLAYMDEVTELVKKNFSEQLGDWCREHQVEYIGHIIEDSGRHCKLGWGPGHFFRGLWGQDMSGIDVVLQQIRPGLEDLEFYRIGGTEYYNGEFFHNLLAKLGSSLGHMDPKKQGRTLCEMFGAYGWIEGTKLMKWLTDHMLVRGINYFVPHAFTMKDFPDPDCPPHFYARGNNPQFPFFRSLMEYTNRVSHLINGGGFVPSVGLLYSAEGHWMDNDHMIPLEKTTLLLSRNQIDYEIIPEEILTQSLPEGGSFRIQDQTMKTLLISERPFITRRVYDWCQKAAEAGVSVIFAGSMPQVVDPYQAVLPCSEPVVGQCCEREELIGLLRSLGNYEILCSEPQPYLRFYHYVQPDGELILFFNEDPVHSIDTWITTALPENTIWYDAYENVLKEAQWEDGKVHLQLSPYEAVILCTGEYDQVRKTFPTCSQDQELSGEWNLKLIPAGSKEVLAEKNQKLVNLARPDQYPDFSGTMIYEKEWDCQDIPNRLQIDLGDAYEAVGLFLNDVPAGVRIAPPYVFEIEGKALNALHKGSNILRVEVANTLFNQQKDRFSFSMPQEPSGLLGPVTIRSSR